MTKLDKTRIVSNFQDLSYSKIDAFFILRNQRVKNSLSTLCFTKSTKIVSWRKRRRKKFCKLWAICQKRALFCPWGLFVTIWFLGEETISLEATQMRAVALCSRSGIWTCSKCNIFFNSFNQKKCENALPIRNYIVIYNVLFLYLQFLEEKEIILMTGNWT